MKNVTLKVLAVLSMVALVLVACNKDEAFSPDNLTEIQNLAPVIKYSSNAIPGSYIVVFKDDAGKRLVNNTWAEAQMVMRDISANKMLSIKAEPSNIHQVYGKSVIGFAANLSATQLDKLRLDPDIAYIEQDQTISLAMGGPPGGGGGGGGSDPQVTPWGIARVGGPGDGEGKRAWVIDSGIDLDHEDLNVNVGLSETFLGGKTTPDDQNGHGTHVAGTIAAINNTIGVVGVAEGAEVVSVRVLNRRGSGSNSGVIAGVNYVAANASSGDVANMSLGGGISTALDNAVLSASSTCAFVLAAGNSSTNASSSSPARVNGNNIYTIASMANGDIWSSFSNYGRPPVDYIEPGSSILSTWKSGGYNTISGTSMAAPHAAGILLLGNIMDGGTVNRTANDSYTVGVR